MPVTVIKAKKLARVEPDLLDGNDILDFAAVLIEDQGHTKTNSGSASVGWSLHGAIGEASRLATDSGAKDSQTARPLRTSAEGLLEQRWPELGNQYEMNDRDDTDQARAAELLRAAIQPGVVIQTTPQEGF